MEIMRVHLSLGDRFLDKKRVKHRIFESVYIYIHTLIVT